MQMFKLLERFSAISQLGENNPSKSLTLDLSKLDLKDT